MWNVRFYWNMEFNFKFNFLSRGELESLTLYKIFLPLFKILPCYEVFFGNFVFAIIAQMLCGNHLNRTLSTLLHFGLYDTLGSEPSVYCRVLQYTNFMKLSKSSNESTSNTHTAEKREFYCIVCTHTSWIISDRWPSISHAIFFFPKLRHTISHDSRI